MSVNAACKRVGEQLEIIPDTLRNWVARQRVDTGAVPGLTTDERTRLHESERENKELRRANAILKTASAFFAAELDRPLPREPVEVEEQDGDLGGAPAGAVRRGGHRRAAGARPASVEQRRWL